MFFDTHVHFDSVEGDDGPDAVIVRARQAGVIRMVAVGGNPDANALAVAVAKRFPDIVAAAVGYDRECAPSPAPTDELRRLIEKHPAVVAVGEIGLDFHYHPDTVEAQESLFARMLELAREIERPVIVHSREADEATVQCLREHANAWRGPADRIGVLHCFTGGLEFARRILDLGYHISFSGILTFRNAAALRDEACHVPDDRLLIETDTPYLAPVPLRGKRNEPAYLRHVAEMLAEIRKCAIERIAELTTANAERLFLGR